MENIIANGDDLLAIGSSKEDREFVKRLLYFNKKDNHTFEFATMYYTSSPSILSLFPVIIKPL